MKQGRTGRVDAMWKLLIEDLFEEFVAFFFQVGSEDYDLSLVEFKDNELELILKDQEEDRFKRFSDKLVKVSLKSDKSKFSMIHVEIEGSSKGKFAQRMFVYDSMIHAKYLIPVRSLGILVDPRKSIDNRYFYEQPPGTSMDYMFEFYSVMNQDPEVLKKSNNPFAIVVMATLLNLRKKRMPTQELMDEFEWLYTKLMKLKSKLRKRKFDGLAVYLNDCMRNSLENKKNYRKFVKDIEVITKNKKIMGVTEYLEEKGRLKGIEEGIEKGIKKGIKKGIEKGRLEGIETGIEKGLEKASVKYIRKLLEDYKWSIAQIASFADVSPYFVRKVKRELQIN